MSNDNKNDINVIVESMAGDGFDVALMSEDEYHQNFSIDGVKVSFCASRQHIDLKDNISKYNKLEVAALETIEAMKIYTIIKYRTKSRDFFDVLTCIKNGKSFQDLIINMQNRYEKLPIKYSEAIIEQRFIKTKLSDSDEGLMGMITSPPNFKEMQDEFKNIIGLIASYNIQTIEEIKKDPSLIKEQNVLNKKFGLLGLNLLEYLCHIKNYKLYEKVLNTGYFNPNEKNGFAEPILHKLIDNGEYDLFDETLLHCNKINDELGSFIAKKKDDKAKRIIDIHKVLNRVLKNGAIKKQLFEKIEDLISIEDFDELLTRKKHVQTLKIEK